MPHRVNNVNYRGLVAFVTSMEEKGRSYLHLLAYIHFLAIENQAVKNEIAREVNGDLTKINFEIITIIQCMFDGGHKNGIAS